MSSCTNMEENMSGQNNYHLRLSEIPIRFEAVNQLTNVFFDDSNKDVFAVRSGGIMGVVVKNANEEVASQNFIMEDRGTVLSIKFSLDHKILAVQRSNSSVEFMNFVDNTLETEYSQSCKKNYNILGFVWSHINEVAFITDHGIELYVVFPEKRILKHLKTTTSTVQWFVWCSANKLALLASAHGSHLLPVYIKQGTINKFSRLERFTLSRKHALPHRKNSRNCGWTLIDGSHSPSLRELSSDNEESDDYCDEDDDVQADPGRMALERDVTLASLYGVPAVLILRHQSGPGTAEVHIYTLSGLGQTPLKSHVLKLGLSGRFAINVVDDVVLVHHQASRSSLIFDTGLPGESDGTVRYHTPIAPAKSIRPVKLVLPGLSEQQTHICDLYSPNWVVFQPNIVIDAKLGCLWHISLCLIELCNQISNLGICTQVALNRTNGKTVLLDLLLKTVKQEKIPLEKFQDSFNHINSIYRRWIESELQSNIASPPNISIPPTCPIVPRVLIVQDDIYNEIFQKLDSEKDQRKTEWLLTSYLTSLSEYNIPVQHILNELLITILAKQNKITVLHQLLQYGVISDSKQMACLLLSLGNMHAAATQMALDMLTRINALEEIQEILLSEGQVLSALKIAECNANPRKFLSIAEKYPNKTLFHSVLINFKNNPQFASAFQKDERLIHFVQQYNNIFHEK